MSKYDITDNMDDWEYAKYNEKQRKQERINALIKKYGYPIEERDLLKEDFVEYDLLKQDLEAMETEQLTQKSTPHSSSLDDEDMDRNDGNTTGTTEQHREETNQSDTDAEILRKIRENNKKQNSSSSQREKREQEIMDQVDDEVDNWSDDDWKNYIKRQSSTEQKAYKTLHLLPEYRILVKNKAKMELAGRRIVNEFGSGAANGIDNLYHRRGMYEIGQRIHTGNILSSKIGGALVTAKEGLDILTKIGKGQPVLDVLLDSLKDMCNNAEGFMDGVHHFKSSREYYKNFDYKRNRKKK
ncbi:MAG: hypothetical protein NC218_01200 [Acetobacter sp.]|nr:hypothetical protein [Acetobacter sp.]